MRLVYTASSESEAKMIQELLKNQGVKAVLELAQHSMALRLNWGGAAVPGEIWEVKVLEQDWQKAHELVPDEQGRHEPKTLTKAYAWYVVVTQVLGVIIGLLLLIYYLISRK